MSYTNGVAVLKMPSGYVLVTEEEMEYIDGGASNNTYKTDRQKALNAEWNKMTNAQRKAARKKAWVTTGGLVLLAAGLPGASAYAATVTVGGYLFTILTA